MEVVALNEHKTTDNLRKKSVDRSTVDSEALSSEQDVHEIFLDSARVECR